MAATPTLTPGIDYSPQPAAGQGGSSSPFFGAGGFTNFPIGDLFNVGTQFYNLFKLNSQNDEAQKAIAAQQEEANRKNEARYQMMLGINQARSNLAQNQLNKTGERISGRVGQVRQGMDAARGIFDNAQGVYNQQANLVGQQLANRVGYVEEGYRRAQSDVEQVGMEERRGIDERKGQADAQAVQASQAIGGASTLLPQFRQRNLAEANRANRDLSEGVAGLRSGLRVQGTEATSAAKGDLASFSERRADNTASLGMARAGLEAEATSAIDAAEKNLTDFMTLRTGIESDILKDRTGIVERRTDAADTASMLALLQQNQLQYASLLQGVQGGGGGGGGGTGLFAGIGGLAGSIFGGGPIGGAIGSAAGGILDGIFG